MDKYCARLLMLAFLVFEMMAGAETFASQTVFFVCDPFPPYVTVDGWSGSIGGSYVQIAKDIFRQIDGFDLDIEIMPWTRCLSVAKSGDRDGILMLFQTPDREEYLEYTGPVINEKMLLWVAADRFPGGLDWNSLGDLGRYSFVVHQDYSITPEWDAAANQGILNVTRVLNNDIALKMVAGHRTDGVPIIDSVGRSLVREHSVEGIIVPVQKPLGVVTYYMAFSRKSPYKKLIPEINRVLKKLTDAGRIDSVLKRRY